MSGFDYKRHMIWAISISLRQQQGARSGFTLLETVISLAISGILAAIAASTWLAQLNIQKLNSARNESTTAISQAKNLAKQQHIFYEVGFRQQGQYAQWAVYPVGSDLEAQNWKSFQDGVRLLETRPDTTLAKRNNVYRVQFNHRGEVNGQMGRVTFSAVSGGGTKRCVIISNLLGTTREGENRPTQTGNPCD